MSAGLKHRLVGTDRIEFTLTGENGASFMAVVSRAHAAGRAWGILADLDPEGAAEEIARTPALQRPVAGLSDGILDPDAFIKKRNGVPILILMALEKGPATQERMRRLTGLTTQRICGTITNLRLRGRVRRVDPDAGRGSRAVWEITPTGVTWLNPRRPA